MPLDGVLIEVKLQEFSVHMPLISALRTPGMYDRHWQQFAKVSGIKFVPEDDMTLDDILRRYDFAPHIADLQAISYIAAEARLQS